MQIRGTLKEIMASKGIKQKELVELTGINQTQLSTFMNGRYPGLGNALKIAFALDLDVCDIWQPVEPVEVSNK